MTDAIEQCRLRIHRGSVDEEGEELSGGFPEIEALCRAFQTATGWPLQLIGAGGPVGGIEPLWSAPVDGGGRQPVGRLVIASPGPAVSEAGDRAAGSRVTPVEAAAPLAGSLAELFGELLRTRAALASREAELSIGVPIARPDETSLQLAMRLEMVLRGGAEGIGCHAAGLYLLDAATTELKLRSHWGLPPDRLTDPPRPLQGSVADLEALTGHAVVLENRGLLEYWNVPEPCGAALCVPVATATALLGTLWLYSEHPRPFSDRETNLAEIVAGRLAVELERETLLSDAVASVDQRQQLDAAQSLLQMQLPANGPESSAWEVSGWAATEMGGSSAFYDWFPAADGLLGVALGETAAPGLVGMLTAQSVRTSLRAHAAHEADPAALLARANTDLWRGAAGDQFAAALCVTFEPDSGQRVAIAAAGSIGAWLLGRRGVRRIDECQVPLGVEPIGTYPTRAFEMEAGDALVFASEAICRRLGGGEGEEAAVAELLESLASAECRMAQQLQRAIVAHFDAFGAGGDFPGGALLVVRRKETVDPKWG